MASEKELLEACAKGEESDRYIAFSLAIEFEREAAGQDPDCPVAARMRSEKYALSASYYRDAGFPNRATLMAYMGMDLG